MSHPTPTFTLSDLDARARDIFREVVEGYLKTGQPVGSKTLALSGGRSLSPATIRSVMAELSRYGLLASPHVSAGRIPTQVGLRLFVDGLLEIGDVSEAEVARMESQLDTAGEDLPALLGQVSGMLAGFAGGAGLVLTPEAPKADTRALRHVEFVDLDPTPLGEAQALVVMVYADGAVENRIMPRPPGLLSGSLDRAGAFLSSRLRGRSLADARADVLAEIAAGEAAIDSAAAALIRAGLADWAGTADTPAKKRNLIVRGQSHLLDNLEARTDVERIRELFDDLERKEELISLLDRAEAADGVKIFIGTENPLFSLSGSSVLIAPYRDQDRNILGALGVIGPTRLNYARVIPLMDYTAEWLGRRLGQN
jgi:heat-inducible transcriptional repressor